MDKNTIHSFFGLSLGFQDVQDSKEVCSSINAEKKLIDELETIIIDQKNVLKEKGMENE